MQPFTVHTGRAVALLRDNVDTDQIIPKQFLKRIERTGFGDYLFHDWRRRPDGSADPDFELNRPEAAGASILLAGANFGCGSSREHAPWALVEYGFRAIIAPSFADIFRSNCAKVGLLCVVLPDDAVRELLDAAPAAATVDLEAQEVTLPSGRIVPFEVDSRTRENLLHGWDDIALTVNREDEIAAYERTRERSGPDTLALGA